MLISFCFYSSTLSIIYFTTKTPSAGKSRQQIEVQPAAQPALIKQLEKYLASNDAKFESLLAAVDNKVKEVKLTIKALGQKVNTDVNGVNAKVTGLQSKIKALESSIT